MLQYLVHVGHKGQKCGEEYHFDNAQDTFNHIYKLLITKSHKMDLLGYCIKDEHGEILEKGLYINELTD